MRVPVVEDDAAVKPFGMRELAARMRAVLRRTGAAEAATRSAVSQTGTFGPLSVDLRTQKVTAGSKEVYLTPKEFELLANLSHDPGAVFRRSEILHTVWDTNRYGTTKTLDAPITSIRKKLGDSRWIESVRGGGFRIAAPA